MRSARVNVRSGSSQPSLSSQQQPKRRCNGLDRQLKNTRLSPQDCHYHSCLWWGHYSTAENTTKTLKFFYPQKDLFTGLLSRKCRNHRAVSQTQEEETEDEKPTHDVWRWIVRFVILPSAFSFFAHLSFYLPWSTYRHHASALVFALSWPVITKVLL